MTQTTSIVEILELLSLVQYSLFFNSNLFGSQMIFNFSKKTQRNLCYLTASSMSNGSMMSLVSGHLSISLLMNARERAWETKTTWSLAMFASSEHMKVSDSTHFFSGTVDVHGQDSWLV